MQLICQGGGDDGVNDFSWARGLSQQPKRNAHNAADDDLNDAFSFPQPIQINGFRPARAP